MLGDLADFKNVKVPNQTAVNVVMRTLDDDVRDHPRKTSIR